MKSLVDKLDFSNKQKRKDRAVSYLNDLSEKLFLLFDNLPYRHPYKEYKFLLIAKNPYLYYSKIHKNFLLSEDKPILGVEGVFLSSIRGKIFWSNLEKINAWLNSIEKNLKRKR